MTRYRFYTVDVFTTRRFGGNQLAVLPDARGLDSATMQQITREFNFSEATFVLPAEKPGHTRRVRIFTPSAEMPFAGHPTLGTAYILGLSGEIALTGEETRIVFEEGVGPIPVLISAHEGKPVFCQLTAARLPEAGPVPPPAAEVAAAYGLSGEDLLGGEYAPQAFSCGVPFLFVPVKNRAVLARIRLDRERWERVLGNWWAKEAFLFSFDPERAGSDLRARMFAPALGIPEDPATGAAAAALAGYLAARQAQNRWVVEQGFEMGRPSILEIEINRAESGAVAAVRVGGASVMVTEGWLTV
jgi:trans-2,3-dihydro-3-hydroxyanthranilate isomerase